jgi:glycosylphosphatidylinositol phospholipase D
VREVVNNGQGFVITGLDQASSPTTFFTGQAGVVTDIGDLNGDNMADFAIGAPQTNVGAAVNAGRVYVVFGRQGGFPSGVDLNALNGSNGFIVNGLEAGDLFGASLSGAGDVNGDGVADLIVGAPSVTYQENNRRFAGAGASYVIFGRTTGFDPVVGLNSGGVFTIFSTQPLWNAGFAVGGAGDVNGDGVDDLIVGASGADPAGNRANGGAGYVIFGRRNLVSDAGVVQHKSFHNRILDRVVDEVEDTVREGINSTIRGGLSLSSINGQNGFALAGLRSADNVGRAVSGAGDINGDGYADVLIAGKTSATSRGSKVFVVYGSASGFSPVLRTDQLNGTNGFVIGDSGDTVGNDMALSRVGDFNGDDLDDIVLGDSSAIGAPGSAGTSSGAAYVVFGRRTGVGPTVDLTTLNGSTGFVTVQLTRSSANLLGRTVSGVGDLNGDGLMDIAIGRPTTQVGQVIVVYGSRGSFTPVLDIGTLNGLNGFLIDGEGSPDQIGQWVSGAGDINGDGLDDLLVSSLRGRPNSLTYAVYGRSWW